METETISIKILETAEEMQLVEELQRLIWPGSEVDIVPAHVLLAASHHGGLVIGAFADELREGQPKYHSDSLGRLIGFVFGFPGLYFTPDGPRPKHHSHMLGVHPDYRNRGLGFRLKRAQWQMVRQQGLDRITWTYDPLLSRNAYLNITKLGAVCNTYLREMYGEMRDQLNIGLPSDRFQVDWWINSQRVNRRLSRKARRQLDLAHYSAGGAEVINPTRLDASNLAVPSTEINWPSSGETNEKTAILLVEIPADFQSIKAANPTLALEWRMHTRAIFERLFDAGYLVTDFIYLPGKYARSFYVLSHGESTL